MEGGIEIRELIFRASVEGEKQRGKERPSEVVRSNAVLTKNLRESIITECMDRMKEYLEDRLER